MVHGYGYGAWTMVIASGSNNSPTHIRTHSDRSVLVYMNNVRKGWLKKKWQLHVARNVDKSDGSLHVHSLTRTHRIYFVRRRYFIWVCFRSNNRVYAIFSHLLILLYQIKCDTRYHVYVYYMLLYIYVYRIYWWMADEKKSSQYCRMRVSTEWHCNNSLATREKKKQKIDYVDSLWPFLSFRSDDRLQMLWCVVFWWWNACANIFDAVTWSPAAFGQQPKSYFRLINQNINGGSGWEIGGEREEWQTKNTELNSTI